MREVSHEAAGARPQAIRVVDLRSGASRLLAAASGSEGAPLLLPNVAAIMPAAEPSDSDGATGLGLLVLTAVGGWLGDFDSPAPFAWSLLRCVQHTFVG